jgi:hypothetical protein
MGQHSREACQRRARLCDYWVNSSRETILDHPLLRDERLGVIRIGQSTRQKRAYYARAEVMHPNGRDVNAVDQDAST